MSQSRKKGKVTMPCHYKREDCLRKVKEDFQAIICENSGRVRPVTRKDDESPVI